MTETFDVLIVVGGSADAVLAKPSQRKRNVPRADFAKWSAIGIQGWSFGEVLTSYKAVENPPMAKIDTLVRC